METELYSNIGKESEENKMKKYDTFFEKERMLYVEAIFKGDKDEASLHMGRMQGCKHALCIMGVDFEKVCFLHYRIMTAIDFAYRMKRYRKN